MFKQQFSIFLKICVEQRNGYEREREMDKKNFERKVTQRNGYERGCKKIMEIRNSLIK